MEARKEFAITASDLALCQRCPRLLAYRVHRGEEGAWRVGIEGSGVAYGSLFHKHIARAFFEAVSDPESPVRPQIIETLKAGCDSAESLAKSLEWVVREYFFAPFLQKYAAGHGSVEQLMAMAAGADQWVRTMADFLAAIPSLCDSPEKNMSRVFFAPEQKLQAVYASPRGTLRVTGCYDALLFNPDRAEATLFEFKSYRRTGIVGPLSQALIYAWLVREATGILPAVQVIYLEGGKTDAFAPADVQKMLAGLPALLDTALDILSLRHLSEIPSSADRKRCSACPFQAGCDKEWGKRDAARGEDVSEAQARMNQLLEVLSDLGLSVNGEGYDVGPAFIRLKVRPDPKKTTVARITNRADDLQVQMQLGTPPLIQAMEGYVGVDIPRAHRKTLTLEELFRAGQASRPDSSAVFPLGMAVDGSVYWVDLTDPNMTSILIGGMSGSGKSVLLRSIVIGLLRSEERPRVRFVLIDPKRVTFSDMRGLDALQGGEALFSVDEAMRALTREVEEMERRFEEMAGLGVDTLDGLNERTGTLRERHVVVIDEYADLMTDKAPARELELLIQRIAQKGRAAGLHLILATQRPQAKVVTGLIKSNLQLHIALKVASRTNSQIILDQGGAQNLLGYGDMLVGGGMGLVRLQGAVPAGHFGGYGRREPG